jgi:hypothetical protein
MLLTRFYSVAVATFGFRFCLDSICHQTVSSLIGCETPTREFNHSSANWLHSSLFLLVFFDSQARISLLGEVDRALLVDNQRRCCAAIAGFRTCCSEAGSNCVVTPPNRELSEPFGRLGTLV